VAHCRYYVRQDYRLWRYVSICCWSSCTSVAINTHGIGWTLISVSSWSTCHSRQLPITSSLHGQCFIPWWNARYAPSVGLNLAIRRRYPFIPHQHWPKENIQFHLRQFKEEASILCILEWRISILVQEPPAHISARREESRFYLVTREKRGFDFVFWVVSTCLEGPIGGVSLAVPRVSTW
jgi:hypothetical protein